MKKINLTNKMKKRLSIILGSLMVVGVVLLSIPKDVYSKILNNQSNIIEEPNNSYVYKTVYVLSKNNELVGLNVKVDDANTDDIVSKWDLLTSRVNTLPLGYHSPIETSTTLTKYELLQNKLTLVLSEDFLNSEGKNALASIAWTFCNEDIEEVVIKVNNEKLSLLKDYYFTKIDKTINVNYCYETSYLFESSHVTIVHMENELLKPVTYFFKDSEMFDFIVSKIFDEELIENNAVAYELEDKELTVSLACDDVLTEEEIKELRYAVMLNFDIKTFVISNNVMTFYEETFGSSSSNTGSVDSDHKITN